MVKYLFRNIIGNFIVDDSGKIVNEDRHSKLESISKPSTLTAKPFKEEMSLQVLKHFRADLALLRQRNLIIAKRKIKNSVSEDNLIAQSSDSIQEMDRAANMLCKRLREWYGLHNPEFSVDKNEAFVDLVLRKPRATLLKEQGIKETMGADLRPENLSQIMSLAQTLQDMYKYRKQTIEYLEKLMKSYCPNLQALAGTLIGAKLIEHTGSLRRLMIMPASTIQILGAEKALFRHLTSGARPPKYGYILHHPYVQEAPKKGRRARLLADKLAICARVDFFKGKFIADKYKKELERKK